LKKIPGLYVLTDPPQSNMVFFGLDETVPFGGEEVVKLASEQGVRFSTVGKREFRMVVHHWIDESAIAKTLEVIQRLIKS
jgi:threonine aldolase